MKRSALTIHYGALETPASWKKPELTSRQELAFNLSSRLILDPAPLNEERLSEISSVLQLSPSRIDSGRYVLSVGGTGLPGGYALKGGAARSMLEEKLELPSNFPARDIDIVRLGTRWDDLDSEISKTLMPEDFSRGKGVELVSSWRSYFTSRDLTINEIIVLDDELIVTPLGMTDTIARVLRPNNYRLGTSARPPLLPDGTAAKLLRLLAEGEAAAIPWTLLGLPEEQELSDFSLALQLAKSFQRSDKVAALFAELCAHLGYVDAESKSALHSLCENLETFFIGESSLISLVPETEQKRFRPQITL
jgi:hypothetical protein